MSYELFVGLTMKDGWKEVALIDTETHSRPIEGNWDGDTLEIRNPTEVITDVVTHSGLENVLRQVMNRRVDAVKPEAFVTDMVNSPPHYQLLPGVEVYDVRMALLEKMEDVPPGQVDDWSRAWEYLTRMWQKNGLEDAKKCRWYLDKLIEKMSDKQK